VATRGANTFSGSQIISGNVGIGVSPGTSLDVVGTTRTSVLSFQGVGGDSGLAHQSYGLYQEPGAWTHPYPDLILNYHTGIKHVAFKGYQGHRFYVGGTAAPTEEAFSVGDGDNNTRVYGDLLVAGTKQVDDAAPATYFVSHQRYLVELTSNYYLRTKQIPDSVLISLCGDEDGCEMIIGMRNWNGFNSQVASYKFHFFWTTATRRWRVSDGGPGGGNTGFDANGAINHALNAYDACYFTDGEYPAGVGSDNVAGMNLLYWSDYGTAKTCFLSIQD
jgi:hypothetical protein